jgi:siroheme synthase (precorrin-2 oxidase/ferrochelatase)
MGLLRNMKLRHRAYVCAYNSFRFASRLRGDLSEFAPSLHDTLQSVADELATLARDSCPTASERRHLIEGLEAALRANGLSDEAQVYIVSQLAPRIMAGEPSTGGDQTWTRIAV